jgi:hypothetical protein
MEIIPLQKKLKKELPWAVKLMPIQKYLKANYYQRKPNYSYIGP